jgi:hypothetical protein
MKQLAIALAGVLVVAGIAKSFQLGMTPEERLLILRNASPGGQSGGALFDTQTGLLIGITNWSSGRTTESFFSETSLNLPSHLRSPRVKPDKRRGPFIDTTPILIDSATAPGTMRTELSNQTFAGLSF